MYIDFEELRPETPRVERALSVREGVLISIIVHLLLLIAILILPEYLPEPVRAVAAVTPEVPRDRTRFVFVEPLQDLPRPQPRVDVDASDQDRVLSTRERPPNPQNELPYARGNSRLPEVTPPRPPTPATPAEPSVARGTPNETAEGQMAVNDPAKSILSLPERPQSSPALRLGESGGTRGRLGDALRNIDRYVQHQSFDNERGSGDAQGLIQFDSKGVDFGPWLRRFVAQVKRNWFVPQAAMILRGHVVITFNIHRNGAITDIEVKKPSQVESFNQAAVNALMASDPTQPLPAQYPTESAFFTVTFLYNEDPADFR